MGDDAVGTLAAGAPEAEDSARSVRRISSGLYGLIVAGVVLSTAGGEERLLRLGLSLVATQAVYWLAETYVHLMAERQVRGRELPWAAVRSVGKDGLSMITVSALPIAVLFGCALLGMDTVRATEFALAATTVLLFIGGFRISRAAGLTGARLIVSATACGMLGLVMVGLKAGLTH